MPTAKLIKKIEGWTGDARLYELSEPLATEDGGTKFVIVSATLVLGDPETYIFPAADADSTSPSNWGELPGSFQGALNHRQALANAGFEVIE